MDRPDLELFGELPSDGRAVDPLRAAIRAATRMPEEDAVRLLLPEATLPKAQRAAVQAVARDLVEHIRAQPVQAGVQALVQEYSLSSPEGVALMCLAEALLRIPDSATRDALIRDKISDGDWSSHLGAGRTLFVNAATWGLLITGKLVASIDDRGLSAALRRLVARAGEPVVRSAVDVAMRMMGEQFVTGQTIEEALDRAHGPEGRGFTFSYDMLGEAAMTTADAQRYIAKYRQAIHAIGRAAAGRGVYAGPGVSIKLSALHPRYSRAQLARVRGELLPVLRELAHLAKTYDIGFNIDAEEADRLDISLDLLQALADDPALAGWQGLGFVVQAYGKRCPAVIDFIIALARRTGRRIMVRLVKGAYWDTEIKRAQVDGLSDYPVYTRKVHTDVAYIACARKLLGAKAYVFPQFATHNAQTLATVLQLAGPEFRFGDWEFQCLHGMGEPLYAQVVGAGPRGRPCRVYAPVGSHETLLAYLVRRLLENGANSSFVNRIGDPDIATDDLVADPVETVLSAPTVGTRHPAIPAPAAILGERRNSSGLDLADEDALTSLGQTLREEAANRWAAVPIVAGARLERGRRSIRNPADARDHVGEVAQAECPDAIAAAIAAKRAAIAWNAVPAARRAAMLERAANAMQDRMASLIGLIVREAGKSLPNAIAEMRESVDFLRYYAERARLLPPDAKPLGPVVCISPWNFPLAIFTGQVAAALAAGNTVLAKPAEETPLVAAEAARILHAAGVPLEALQFLPGDGAIGAALVAAPETAGVVFTGSTEVARLIQAQLARRVDPAGRPIPLIAETGGQNAMIVDSSALTEQVVADVVVSAFDSAGQRCSALRLLCLQEEIADRTLDMLKGAMRELQVGRPDRLSVDVGPVITPAAQANIARHVAAMRAAGCRVHELDPAGLPDQGNFVVPTIIEIDRISDLGAEVFGPILHVLRYRAGEIDGLVEQINASGYGLTFGLHTRLDHTIERVCRHVEAGNIYVNRNVIGAVVGVQPFGGRGLSGTGPKAGGPLYVARLLAEPPRTTSTMAPQPAVELFAAWLASQGSGDIADHARSQAKESLCGLEQSLAGPAGELNLYRCRPRGRIGLLARSRFGLWRQLAAVLATGNRAVIASALARKDWIAGLPEALTSMICWSDDVIGERDLAAVLAEHRDDVASTLAGLAEREGAIVPLQLACGGRYDLMQLVDEVSVSINTAAAGGSAALMTLDVL